MGRRMQVLAMLAAVWAAAGVVRADMLVNGSFEDGPATGSFLMLSAGSTAIDGWTITSGTIDYIGPYWTADDGGHSLDMNGTGPGSIAQTFDTEPGTLYTVMFQLAGNPVGGPAERTLGVSAAGQSAQVSFEPAGHSPTDMGWVGRTWQFTAVDTQTTLAFHSLVASGAYGPALDHVVVVPEPATMSLLAVAGLAALGRRRRRDLPR